jgi:hypothetical protein
MRSLGLSRYALSSCVAAALLTGCGGSQPPFGAPGAMQQGREIATQVDRSGSWMLPEATSEDLLYATGGCGGTCVLAYPSGKLVGTLPVGGPTAGACTNSSGDVFISDNDSVFEYRHGTSSPIAILNLPGTNAAGCAVDPTTGNLAVTFDGSYVNVAIFPNASGTPSVYLSKLADSFSCGYDGSGNLFTNGISSEQNKLSELPRGGSQFQTIAIGGDVYVGGQVQWDGKYLTYESAGQKEANIYRLSISGSTAAIIGRTHLRGPIKWVSSSDISGKEVIVPYAAVGTRTSNIGVWKYPRGGRASITFKHSGNQHWEFSSVALSIAAGSSPDIFQR